MSTSVFITCGLASSSVEDSTATSRQKHLSSSTNIIIVVVDVSDARSWSTFANITGHHLEFLAFSSGFLFVFKSSVFVGLPRLLPSKQLRWFSVRRFSSVSDILSPLCRGRRYIFLFPKKLFSTDIIARNIKLHISESARVLERNFGYRVDMDDFELFRARSMHGDLLGGEQFPVERLGHRRAEGHQHRKCKFESKSKAPSTPGNIATEDAARDCRTRTSKFRGRSDDVIAIPKIVRCSNAWVDFSTTELPVRNTDQDQKSLHWHRPRNAWMPRSKTSVSGFSFPEQAVTHEFDVYRLRSFATASGRIVNRGDYFRVRQRIHPADADQMERFQGPVQPVSENSTKVAVSPSNSPTSTTHPSSTIEYRPVVYYATNDRDAADGDETAVDDIDEDFSDERTKLLADRDRSTGYFSRITHRSRSGGERRGSHRRGREDDGDNAAEPPSTDVPDNDLEQSRVRSPIRVVVLGDRGVGKTTLACQLLTSEHLATRSTCFNFTQGKSPSLM